MIENKKVLWEKSEITWKWTIFFCSFFVYVTKNRKPRLETRIKEFNVSAFEYFKKVINFNRNDRYLETRKVVNYTRWLRRKKKFFWRFYELLTCKSSFRAWYRSERLIELSSSWFLLKFSSEQLISSKNSKYRLWLALRILSRGFSNFQLLWNFNEI